MRLYVGTSGYSYAKWHGEFYPSDLDADQRLEFYGRRIATVEINNTFYRMPKRAVLQRWADAVPDHFRFVIKAPRRITHDGRLHDEDGAVAILVRQLKVLGPKRGPILFQTPPYLPARVERLEALVAKLPEGFTAAFEFRHRSWEDAKTREALRGVLRGRGHTLCVAEPTPEDGTLDPLGSWVYLRLRAPEYDESQLRFIIEYVRDRFEQAYVFFKHEDRAPQMAERMTAVARQISGVEL